MARIVVLGAGVMGSALAVPAAAAPGNAVTLVGSPLDGDAVDAVRASGRHPALDAPLPGTIETVHHDALDPDALRAADVVVLGVSSPGVGWATSVLESARAAPPLLALVTKGLVARDGARDGADGGARQGDAAPLTYADALPASLCSTPDGLVGIGGPCIARELALGVPTRVTFASRHRPNAERLRELLRTDVYRPTVGADVVGVEACAALKNFLCIGIAAMLSAHPLGDSHAKNPLAALFNQGVQELAALSDWLRRASAEHRARDGAGGAGDGGADAGTSPDAVPPAFDLAGAGDLHVTVGGGRNSRLGRLLGEGATLGEALAGPMRGVTAEGVDTGRALSRGFRAACGAGALDPARLPLTRAILDCVDDEARPFAFDFRDLPD